MKPCPTIAVVGASVRAVAFSLLRAGCQVVAADLFADADLARVCPATKVADYPAELADWLANTKCDGWLYTGALENHIDLIDRMAETRPLLGNRGEVLQEVRNPLRLQQILTEANLRFPETKECDGSTPGEGEWLHKTCQGGNGSGVQRWHSLRAGGFIPPVVGYWQQKIKGTPGSAQYVGGKLHGVTRQLIGEPWLGAGEFQYAGTLAPWELPPRADQALSRLGELLANRCSLRGLFGVDFVFDGEQPWIIEVNPRATAAIEVVERVTGHNLLAQHLAACGISRKTFDTTPIPAVGKAIVYAKHSLAVSRSLSEQLFTGAGPMERPHFGDIPTAGTQIEPGEPILTILTDGADIADVESTLRQKTFEIERELYCDAGDGSS